MLNHDVKIICVLRKSHNYDVDYVVRLKEQAAVYAPDVPFLCISNVGVKCAHVPMLKLWPGWWSKMEIFRPGIEGDMLFIDLDTIIVDEIWDFLNVKELTMLTDFYKPDGLGSGLMYIPKSARADIWNSFVKNSIGHMSKFRAGGDQAYLMSIWKNSPARWQEVLPGRAISYKAHHVAAHGVPEDAGIVCHHGLPKPRDIKWNYPNLEYSNGRWLRK